jgi:hypothetical protein
MILKTVKERYKSMTWGSKLKRLHWWNIVKHQPKWRAKFTGSSSIDPWVSSSDRMIEEEVYHPMGRDRAKAAMQKGKRKGKEGSTS